jgi:hypothetical protein
MKSIKLEPGFILAGVAQPERTVWRFQQGQHHSHL